MANHTPDPATTGASAAGWAAFQARHRQGDVMAATVTRPLPFGALVEVDGVPGLLTGFPGVRAGGTVTARLQALDPTRHRISLTPA
ncbi:hypothetical protein [Micromonospora humi]|uniref:Uncharacterized protein n=1 Tax=Micromonospora humi TaxID=745366 RepID=A0A1C5I4L2_9ACTN|nr:hypothetical protein [Micromonospora humi]SCG53198.1 hypothetical protein GA0070213_104441 [Micromonospora humi]